DKSSQFTNWSLRPLSAKQIEYALGDVIYLVDVYRSLSEELAETNRTQWVFEEEEILRDPATYNIPYEDVWKRIKMRGPTAKNLAVLQALAAWREESAQKKDLPRNWIMRDEVLATLAQQMPL